ncbi:MAG TPA: hypothetical protein DCP92_07025 [Nitrospiraceae bacterium]|nr:hypothetical protein [Nitrospiraceae bacterium]
MRLIYHHLADRVRAHVFLCMLAYYVEWHMRQKLAPILFDDDDHETAEAQRKIDSCSCGAFPQGIGKSQDKTKG